MNLKNLGKLALVGAFAATLVRATDKVAPRATAQYPTPKRVVLVMATAAALNIGGAFLERKLGLNEKNVKFPFKD